MAETTSMEESLHDHIRLVIGFLFGSGGVGAAIAMIQNSPDVRPWGMAILVFCFLFAGSLFWWSERAVDRRGRFCLQKLNTAYVRVLNVIGHRLTDRLETASAEARLETGMIRSYVMNTLADLMLYASHQPQDADEGADWLKSFQDSMNATVTEWRNLATTEDKVGYFPPGGAPTDITE